MQKLTKAEEQVMQIIWELGSCMVSEILENLGIPKPPHSTISSVVRILDKKGFLTHKAYGRTYVYSPKITKSDYSKFALSKMANSFFGGSVKQLVSFLVKENDLDLNEISDLMNQLEKAEKNTQNDN
jgi:predicted transcriptional regulator